MKYAIIVTTQFKGQTEKFRMNSGVVCSEDEAESMAQFAEFIKANAVKAKLIRVNKDHSDGETLAESEFTAPMVV